MPKGFWKSRTFWLNAITLAVAVLVALLGQPLVAEHSLAVMILTAIVAGLNVVLRFLTGTPISVAPPKPESFYGKYPRRGP